MNNSIQLLKKRGKKQHLIIICSGKYRQQSVISPNQISYFLLYVWRKLHGLTNNNESHLGTYPWSFSHSFRYPFHICVVNLMTERSFTTKGRELKKFEL